jgi:hypothetical protein
MKKPFISLFCLASALCCGPVMAAQNVTNTSQKGSLLIWPLVDVDPADDAADTLIEISSDQNGPTHIECEYVNQKKGRVNFDFTLTAKATASWVVSTGAGLPAPLFPSGGTFTPGNPNQGELVCFAVDGPRSTQIAFNHLIGSATVVHQNDSDASQAKQAFRYKAWAFTARGATGPAADNTPQGTPGTLSLTGGGAGTYDACPLYNIENFNPNGATLGSLTTLDNDLWVVSCNVDLRQDFLINQTKLKFTAWNANENSFTGSYQCADSVTLAGLSSVDNSLLVNPANFDFSTLRTANARLQVQGIASTQCPGSTAAGLLGVLTSSVGINDSTEDAELGSNTSGAGATAGFVLWDPAGTVPQVHTR